MTSDQFTVGQKFKVLSKAVPAHEIRTVEKIEDDYIVYSSNLNRWKGTDQIMTNVSLGAVTIELLPSPLEHYTKVLDEATRAEAVSVAAALLLGTPQGEEIIDFGREILK